AVLSSGAVERGIVFGGNDRPGIMMGAAVRTYANRFSVAAGRRVVVFTNNNDGWRTARDLRSHNVEVAAVIDTRPAVPDAVTANFGSRIVTGGTLVGTEGGGSGRAANIRAAGGTG